MAFGSRAWICLALSVATAALWAPDAHADRRVALVIGNGAYSNAPKLPNPPNDAQDVAAALKRTGFDVVLAVDADKAGMDDAEIRFARAARAADVAIFYYSGHAMQMNGVNYLMPIDAKLSDEADLRRMERVDDIVNDLQQAKNLSILVLDSCRDNPLAEDLKRSIGRTRGVSITRGLAKIDNPQGMIVAYSTQANQTAEDGTGRNSPYTAAFLKHIEQSDEITTVFKHVAADVYESTGQRQRPELSLSAIGDFYLKGRSIAVAPNSGSNPVPPPPSNPCGAAEAHWRSTEFDRHAGGLSGSSRSLPHVRICRSRACKTCRAATAAYTAAAATCTAADAAVAAGCGDRISVSGFRPPLPHAR